MEEAHSKDVDEVLAHFQVSLDSGLTDYQVQQARGRYGRNELQPEEATPLWKLVLRQFDDLLVKILIVAAIVDFVIALTDGESILKALVEPLVIVLILIANATVGVITERNAEAAIGELKAYEAENATVLRNGALIPIAASDLVPGDVVEVTVGSKVPADIRLAQLMTNTLRCDQSILTGESDSVEKQVAAVGGHRAVYQDKRNVLFSGTMVTSGRGRGVVVATGGDTAIGKIRDAMSDQVERLTPLKQKLDEFGSLLSKVIAAICVLVWVVNINRFSDPALGGWLSGALYHFKIAVALAVAAIPEGLPAVVTTCLALGTRRMAQQNALVRTLPSVETLGCTTVICSDKTGTLTTNQMSVVKAAVVQSAAMPVVDFDITGTTFSPKGTIYNAGGMAVRQPGDLPALQYSAMCAALCNDSVLSYDQGGSQYQRIGEATELALRVFAEKVGLPTVVNMDGTASANGHWQGAFERTSCFEFTRDRKMMSVTVAGEGRGFLFTKGAPESVLASCTQALCNNGDGVVPMSEGVRQALLEQVATYGSGRALRCLALAYKPLPPGRPATEDGLVFAGLLGMHDPPRLECRDALETCRAAGIRVVMVTGDNKATATAVARQVGAIGMMSQGESLALTGAEFDALSPSQQEDAVANIGVFSRVEPLHKLRLVELLRAQGHVVAMTGDGVNDAPALVKADIGIAMGSGTAVARQAADMVLADDNFATIVAAVREGRAIYANTKQFIRYMISSNIGEVVAIFIAALLGIPEVLTPVQLLWVNLVTDGLPATALGFNRPDRDIMLQAPRRIDEPIVNGWLFVRYVIIGAYVGIATAWGFIWWFLWYENGPRVSWADLTSFQRCTYTTAKASGYSCDVFADKHPKTISMSVLVMIEMFNALNNLSENGSLLRVPPWDNLWLLGAIAVSVALHCMIVYVPWFESLFSVIHLSWGEWRMVLLLSAPVILIDELLKYISRQRLLRGAGGVKGRPRYSGSSAAPLRSITIDSPQDSKMS